MWIRKILPWLLILVALFVAACGGGGDDNGGDSGGSDGGGEAATVVDPATAGSIAGTVNFTGTAPEPELIQMDAEPTCMAEYSDGPFTETVVVNDNGTLANVFIYVKTGLEDMTFATPSEPVVLDQDGCRYHPHVFGVQTNQTVLIRNSDDVLHNIHPEPSNSRSFNVSQPNQGMETERTFPSAEIMIPVSCDVHSWMSAFVGVVDHPYFAVSSSDGSFELPNLPPGDYEVEAWHELYGTQTMNVTVSESEAVTLDFSFEGG
jgi:hypothetical protein